MANLRHTVSAKSQRGAATLDQIVATVLSLLLLAAMSALANDYMDAQTDKAAADWLNRWATGGGNGGGAEQWMRDNAAACAGGCTATHAQLVAGGYLPIGAAATDGFGHTAQLRVIVDGAGHLEGLVCASGGITPSVRRENRIARYIGLAGGYVPPSNPAIAKGPAWGPVNLSTYGYSAGGCSLVIALFVAESATSDDYLHRHATPGHPELNRMSTAIDMAGNDINNAGTVNANLLKLPGGNSINIGGSYLYGDGSNLATRAQSGNLYIQTASGGASGSIAQVHNISGDANSTFTAQWVSAQTGLWSNSYVNTNGTVWAAGNISTNANVVANGAVYASNWLRTYGNTGWYSESYGGGWYMQDGTWIRAYNNKNIYTAGEIQGGTIHADNSLVSDGIVTVTKTASPNSGCGGTGQLVNANNGTGFMQCLGGKWVSMNSSGGTWHGGPASTGNYSATNTTGKTMFVAVTVAGAGCASYRAYASVSGMMVANVGNYNPSYAKYGSMLFPVPAGGSFSIIVVPYSCSTQWYAAYFY